MPAMVMNRARSRDGRANGSCCFFWGGFSKEMVSEQRLEGRERLGDVGGIAGPYGWVGEGAWSIGGPGGGRREMQVGRLLSCFAGCGAHESARLGD